jgi:hypothetical protein
VGAVGAELAAVLAGAWRATPPLWHDAAGTLPRLAPLLLRGAVAALAWRRLRQTQDARTPAGALLQDAYRLQALRSAVHDREVAEAFRFLRASGVEPVLGKGWAAARLYPDPALRPYGDVDLYVAAESHAAATAVLFSGRPVPPVDLHAGFAELDDRTPDDLAARLVTVEVDGTGVRTFGAEDHLRLLCLHALRHGMIRPLWLCDIAAGIERRPAGFDWDRFQHGDRRRTAWAVAAVGLAHAVLGASLDGIPLAEPASRLPRWLVPSVLEEWGRSRAAQGAREPMAAVLRHPSRLATALALRWPNAVEATVGVGGAFGAWPRLPYQVAECLRRGARFAATAVSSWWDRSRSARR